MALVLWITAALVLWIVMWSLGYKAMDSFLLASLVALVGATLEILKRYLPNKG